MKTIFCLLLLFLLASFVSSKPHEKSVPKQRLADLDPFSVVQSIGTKLKDYDPITLPFIPKVFSFEGISLTLDGVTFRDFSNITVLNTTGYHPGTGELIAGVKFNQITFEASHYSSGGYVKNMPFSGQGPLQVSIIDFDVSCQVHISIHPLDQLACADQNTTFYVMELARLLVQFVGMDPGTDQGELINTVLSSFGTEIVDYLEILLNSNTPLRETVDCFIVTTINSVLCKDECTCTPISTEDCATSSSFSLDFNKIN